MRFRKKDKERLIDCVVSAIIRKYNLSEADSIDAVLHSAFLKILPTDPAWIFHYPAEYWADDIFAEHLRKLKQ